MENFNFGIQSAKTGNGYLIPTFYNAESEKKLKEYIRIAEDGEDIDATLMEVFTEQYATDGDCELNRIIGLYDEATDSEKAIMDNTFVSLCGWSLPTLIGMCLEKYKEENGEDKED